MLNGLKLLRQEDLGGLVSRGRVGREREKVGVRGRDLEVEVDGSLSVEALIGKAVFCLAAWTVSCGTGLGAQQTPQHTWEMSLGLEVTY